MNSLWYKNAIIYCLDIESFFDTKGDGVGDVKGLKHRLNYLSNLGIDCIWILPFFDSPNRDNGYDVRDYYQVDRRLGDLGHFAELLEAANEAGIRIIIDLVLNHTSEEHFWFQEARKDKNSEYRDFYIWSEEKPEDDGSHAIFGEKQGNSNWKYDKEAGAFYYHTFYSYQPDLNISNPAVQDEIMRIMHFWLKIGVSGFRVDAAPHMIRQKGNEKFQGDPHDIFRKFRRFVEDHKQDAILLAEVDVDPHRYADFFGKEDQMHMLLNFYINNFLFLSLARKKATPIAQALKDLPHFSEKEQLANFVRNHDELDLERLSEEERNEVLDVFAPEENMRIYGRGIRRRLAPMLSNDRRRMELVYSLLFTLPGTPLLRYGQEIGMGEDLSLKERESVRTTMQWSDDQNGGFSKASKDKLVRASISEGDFSFHKVNVAAQERDPESLLNWMSRAINYRRETPAFGTGATKILSSDNPAVLALSYNAEKDFAVALHNFSEKEENVQVEFDFSKDIVEIFGDKEYEEITSEDGKIQLAPFGYRWFRKKDFV